MQPSSKFMVRLLIMWQAAAHQARHNLWRRGLEGEVVDLARLCKTGKRQAVGAPARPLSPAEAAYGLEEGCTSMEGITATPLQRWTITPHLGHCGGRPHGQSAGHQEPAAVDDCSAIC